MTQMISEEQFQNLIQRPLETLDSTCPVLVIILDALDECDDQYATLLLRLIRTHAVLAQGSFIWATTVGGILGDTNFRDPEKQLRSILSMDQKNHLDEIYAKVLERACPPTVNIFTLASLLCSATADYQAFAKHIRATVLTYLQAVLVVPEVEVSRPARDVQPIRFIHTSFVDYLTDATRCSSRFLVDLPKHHTRLATGCLERACELRRNMYDLDPSLLNSEVSDLTERIREKMSPGLQYVCVHMAVHVSRVPAASVEIHGLLGEFVRGKIMYWLEGLSLMGRTPDAVGMTAMMEALVRV
ncbi:hypothetical protein FRB97_002208 [Tulasnella sp. 331]|nr:hypothetical protein FRB97_002208 [Tulasnella sp. 331]